MKPRILSLLAMAACLMLAFPVIGSTTKPFMLAERGVKSECSKGFKTKRCKAMMTLLDAKVSDTAGNYHMRRDFALKKAALFCAQKEAVLCEAYNEVARLNNQRQIYLGVGICVFLVFFMSMVTGIGPVSKLKEIKWATIHETKLFKKIVTGVIVGVVSSVVLYIFAIPKVNVVGALGFCIALAVSFLFG